MATSPLITHGTWVLIGDASKVMIFREEGTSDVHDLHMLYKIEAPDNPASAAQGTDAPGREGMRGRPGASAMEGTDWHDLAERDFLRETIALVQTWAEQDGAEKLVLVAPPRALATLREAMPRALRDIVVAELDKDYVHHPLPEITRLLAATT